MANVGKPKRRIIVEPLTRPKRETAPPREAPVREPVTEPAPSRPQREKVPA
jgi:hypothetical protein